MKNIKLWVGLCAVILTFGVIGSYIVIRESDDAWIEIVQDGNMLYNFNLEQAENQIINIEYKGKTNVLEIKEHKIYVLEADCPDQICKDRGFLESSNLPVICLPNRLVIQFVQNKNDADAVAR